MDYNLPPTTEFEMLTDNTRYPNHWMTMMKSVMNDYWFDAPTANKYLTVKEIDHMMHKLYYCWLQQMIELYPDIKTSMGEEE